MRLLPLIILLFSLQAWAAKQDSLSISKIHPPAYYHLTGKIDSKYAITMDLVLTYSYWGNWGAGYRGYYYYNIYKKPIEIEMSFDKYQGDTINIKPEGNERFKGKFDGTIFTGMWYQEERNNLDERFAGKKLKQLPFTLTIDTSDCFKFIIDSYSDSLVLFKKLAYPAKAFFSYALLFNNDTSTKKLDAILSYFYGHESRYMIEHKMKADGKSMLNRFKTGAYDLAKDSALNMLGDWHIDHHTNVIYNSSKLLSVKFTYSNNEGGNHGYRYSEYKSFSVKDQRWVRIEDIIDPKDYTLIKTIMVKQMEKDGWPPGLVASNVNLPKNFYVTPKGLSLIYEDIPGIGGALFQLPVFIPFTEFGDKIKKQSWME